MKKRKNAILGCLLAAFLVCGGVALAQRPGVDIGSRHSNLAEAQSLIQQAYDKIEVAQKDNRNHLGDHANKAKQLLAEASRELKAAAEYANNRRR